MFNYKGSPVILLYYQIIIKKFKKCGHEKRKTRGQNFATHRVFRVYSVILRTYISNSILSKLRRYSTELLGRTGLKTRRDTNV